MNIKVFCILNFKYRDWIGVFSDKTCLSIYLPHLSQGGWDRLRLRPVAGPTPAPTCLLSSTRHTSVVKPVLEAVMLASGTGPRQPRYWLRLFGGCSRHSSWLCTGSPVSAVRTFQQTGCAASPGSLLSIIAADRDGVRFWSFHSAGDPLHFPKVHCHDSSDMNLSTDPMVIIKSPLPRTAVIYHLRLYNNSERTQQWIIKCAPEKKFQLIQLSNIHQRM